MARRTTMLEPPRFWLTLLAEVFTVTTLTSFGEDTAAFQAQIRKAVDSGLRILEKSAAAYPDNRSCFSCHHQTLPLQAMATARKGGFKVDQALFQAQAQFTYDSFRSRIDALSDGTGVGGKSMTAAYGLWALSLADRPHDDTTATMVRYLLKTQSEDGQFWSNKVRPPLEDSGFTATALSAFFMQKFAPPDRQLEIERSANEARNWLLRTHPSSQEDRTFRLWGLHALKAERGQVENARTAVLDAQRSDGGWAQLSDMLSDAYATGQTLFALQETGTAVDHPAYQRGVRHLLESQLPDGSWHVKTRSKPVQTFFDSDFPHGKDQFISVSATSWAVAALAAAHSR